MPKFIAVLLISLLGLTASAQQNQAKGIQWLSLAEAEKLAAAVPKPILIDLYTEWCGWCKVMDKRTYRQQKVMLYLQDKFYAVKLDAETKQSLNFKGKTYAFNPQYKTNEIALFLTGGQLSYPTTIIIPAADADPQPIAGFLEPKEFELIVKYFGEGAYKTVAFTQYQQNFKGSW
jgi:thioredoxin-related protein